MAGRGASAITSAPRGFDNLPPTCPWLERIDQQQTPGCGVVLSWGASEPVLPS